jgi:hypothetical protein
MDEEIQPSSIDQMSRRTTLCSTPGICYHCEHAAQIVPPDQNAREQAAVIPEFAMNSA